MGDDQHGEGAHEAMKIPMPPWVKGLDNVLSGYPEGVITAILLAIGVFAIAVALFTDATMKILLTAYLLTP